MPKRYEEEINEILHKHDWPPTDRARSRHRGSQPFGLTQLLGSVSPEQIMAGGIVLIFAGVVTRLLGLGLTMGLGGYTTAFGFLVLLAGYVMAVRRIRGSSASTGPRQRFWRGQVIDLRPAGTGLAYWWWRLTQSFRRRS